MTVLKCPQWWGICVFRLGLSVPLVRLVQVWRWMCGTIVNGLWIFFVPLMTSSLWNGSMYVKIHLKWMYHIALILCHWIFDSSNSGLNPCSPGYTNLFFCHISLLTICRVLSHGVTLVLLAMLPQKKSTGYFWS